jgi:hypothetical protein
MGQLFDRVRIAHAIETGDQFRAAWTTLGCHADTLGLLSTDILRPILYQHFLRRQLITHAGVLVAPGADRTLRCCIAT